MDLADHIARGRAGIRAWVWVEPTLVYHPHDDDFTPRPVTTHGFYPVHGGDEWAHTELRSPEFSFNTYNPLFSG